MNSQKLWNKYKNTNINVVNSYYALSVKVVMVGKKGSLVHWEINYLYNNNIMTFLNHFCPEATYF